MTFNSNADVSGSGAKRRGPGGGVIAGVSAASERSP
jgi:hypothetical protein